MSELPGIDPEALDALFARAEKVAARAGCAVQLAIARQGTGGFRLSSLATACPPPGSEDPRALPVLGHRGTPEEELA